MTLDSLSCTINGLIPTVDNLNLFCGIKFYNFTRTLQECTRVQTEEELEKSIWRNGSEEIFPKYPEKYVTNLSDITLNKLQLEALSLGFKFSVPCPKVSRIDVESQFEYLNSQLVDLQPSTKDNVSWFKAKCVDLANQFMTTPQKHHKLLSPQHREALNDLMNNDKIVILRPDKGSGVVVMNRSDYLTKMYDIIGDTKRFLPDDKGKDMTQQTEKNISKILHRLFRDKVIDNALLNSLKPRGSQLPRMYGLPKIHKNSVPLRPILAMMSSPQHKLARWLASIIDPIRKSISKFSLKDSFEFAHRLEDKNSCTSFMVSFDVVSLFTNIPLEETIDIVCKYSAMINIPEDNLRQLLLLCTKNVQFTFNGQIYRQVDGVAMGSPLGPILADIFLSSLENKLDGVIQDTYLYVRYVDDTFLLCRNKNQAKQLLQMFNSVHPNMKFTMEEEHSNRLSFLDVSILRKIASLSDRLIIKILGRASIYHLPASARFNIKKDSYEIYSSGHIVYALKKLFSKR